MSQDILYLDHNATTAVLPAVREAMMPFLGEEGFNPSSPYGPAHRVRVAIDRAREEAAALLACEPEEIVFTSGATESCNMVILGLALHAGRGSHLITVATEHHAVLNAVRAAQSFGCDVTTLSVDRQGRIDPDELRAAFRPGTILVAVMLVNNETGVMQDVSAIGRECREKNVRFLCDATAAIGKMAVHPREISCDFLALSGHKFHAPKGVGVLYVRRGEKIYPILYGGEQEEGLRPGTENVPGIVGLGAAARLAGQFVESGGPARLAKLRDAIESDVRRAIPNAETLAAGAPRVCNTSLFRFPSVRNDEVVVMLDRENICISTGAACSTGASLPSHVVRAMGYSDDAAREVVRVSLGAGNGEGDVTRLVSALTRAARQLHTAAVGRT